ncbi:MAG: HNH endonuclease [Planctomycetota bacterium]|nr:HNH endonuclease [Planctomycetota bacterium]
MAIPSPEQQVEFLRKVQRLLSEGLFVASYKFALLRALADLAVLKGEDSDAELALHVNDIAGAVIELYWRQSRPFYPAGGQQAILKQNTGKQAAIIQTLASVQAEYRGSLPQLRHDLARWNGLVGKVADVICVMPLWKLQRIGDDVVDFLYPNVGKARTITLRPGVTYCLRNFYGLLRNLIEGAWLGYVRNLNLDVLGQTIDFAAFLFGTERTTLDGYRPILLDVQRGSCFYCRRPLTGAGDVDHFVPWSRYPVDLGHNFVVAHKTCNARKVDYLAAEEHLGAWAERNRLHGEALGRAFADASLPYDVSSSVSITRWAYRQTATAGGLVWVQDKTLKHLDPGWERLLAG